MALLACGSRPTESVDEPLGAAAQALAVGGAALPSNGLTGSNLQLAVSKNSCSVNGAQDYFKVTNGTGAALTLSDLSIKYWINDTSGNNVAPQVWYGGCVTNSDGTCTHAVAGVTATATQFAPACGPNPSQQANWEITIKTTDHTPLAAGQSWSNLQTAVNLANYAPFTPGTNTWFSGCGNGGAFGSDAHFAVYLGTQLVDTSGITAPSCRSPHGQQQLTGYLTPAMSAAPVIGPVPGTTRLSLAVGLPLRNVAQLQAFLQSVEDPNSPSYRKYLGPADFASSYGPLASDYSKLVDWAHAKHLDVGSYPNALLADISGTVADLDAAFYVNFQYAWRADGSKFYEPDREPSLDLPVAIQAVAGTDNFVPPQPAEFVGTMAPSGARAPVDLRAAYLGNTTCTALTGAGQSIGLLGDGYSGFTPGDISTYLTTQNVLGQSLANSGFHFQPIEVRQPSIGTPQGPVRPLDADGNSSSVEITLDIEMSLAMAPEARIVVFQGSVLLDSILQNVASNNAAIKQLSSSFNFPVDGNTPGLMMWLAAQGQSVFSVSGDAGAFQGDSACTKGPPPFPSHNSDIGHFEFPTDMRTLDFLTVVGGTNLENAGGLNFGSPPTATPVRYADEMPWAFSGGGILGPTSLVAGRPIPAYQALYLNGKPLNGASTLYRNLPDVSMQAANVFVVVTDCQNQLVPFGKLCPSQQPDLPLNVTTGDTSQTLSGTSVAAPLWAAYTALANQQATQLGLGSVGFLNPALYRIASDPGQYPATFNDVPVLGNTDFVTLLATSDGDTLVEQETNTNSCQLGYTAGPGYDLVTGLGSPKCGLLGRLAGGTVKPSLQLGLSQDTLFGLQICASGAGFTPSGQVSIQYADVPIANGQTQPTGPTFALTASASGNVSFSDATTFDASYMQAVGREGLRCTDAQCAQPVILQMTDVATGLTTSATIPSAYWCTGNQGFDNASFTFGTCVPPECGSCSASSEPFSSGSIACDLAAPEPTQPDPHFNTFSWNSNGPAVSMGTAVNRACFLLEVGGKFKGGGEAARVRIEGDQWILDGSSLTGTDQPVTAAAGCFDAPALSMEYSWFQGLPPSRMVTKAGNLCFLTSMTGDFEGGGESIRVLDDGEFWQLGGTSEQAGVAATARCVPERSSFVAQWAEFQAPTALVSLPGAVCFLSAVGGHFEGGGETVFTSQTGNDWQLFGTSQQPDGQLSAAAQCLIPCRGKGC
jgi:Pro-kumamolisin, activation domain/Cellulose binding domain